MNAGHSRRRASAIFRRMDKMNQFSTMSHVCILLFHYSIATTCVIVHIHSLHEARQLYRQRHQSLKTAFRRNGFWNGCRHWNRRNHVMACLAIECTPVRAPECCTLHTVHTVQQYTCSALKINKQVLYLTLYVCISLINCSASPALVFY